MRKGIATILVAAVVAVIPAGAQARSKVFLACGTHHNLTPTTKYVTPRNCVFRAYDLTQLTYVNIDFRGLRWRNWGTGRATARGRYAISGFGWNTVSLTASHRVLLVGKLRGTFYTRLAVVDTCRCGFIGPGRGFVVDTTPSE